MFDILSKRTEAVFAWGADASGRLPARLRVAQLPQHAAVLLHDLLPGRLFFGLLGRYYGVKKR